MIPAGTILFFRGDLLHAGPRNSCDWPRTAVFFESYRKSIGPSVKDAQMHPMQVAIYQYNIDNDVKKFFDRIKQCEEQYGKSNKPLLTELLNWPIVKTTTTLERYKRFKNKKHVVSGRF